MSPWSGHSSDAQEWQSTPANWLTAAFAIGSVHWWAAGTGTVWLHAQVVAVFFSLLALHLAVRRRWPLLAGLFLGCAAASRLPVGLTLPLYLALYLRIPFPPALRSLEPADLRSGLSMLAGLAVPATPRGRLQPRAIRLPIRVRLRADPGRAG